MHVIIRPPAADFGPERALTLLAGVRQYADDLRDLMETLLVKQTMVFAEPSGVQVTTNVTIPAPLAGDASIPISPPSRSYRVVVTGDLEGWERETFKEAAEALGHKVVGAISKKVDFLITNFPNSGTNKVRDAQALGLPVHGEEEATQLLGLPWPGPKASRPGAPGPLRQTNLDDL
jgi:NAD-dependent DNA ligase